MSHHQHDQDDAPHQPGDEKHPEAQDQLQTTAEHWRDGQLGDEAQDSADEVARGAERGAKQPDYGREGQ